MKKLLIVFAVISFFAISANAEPWAHRYDGTGGQSWRASTNQNGTTLTVAVEWNQSSWNHSDFGWGTSTDGSGWNWQDCPWFEDGSGSDKRCRTDVQFMTNGTFYYAFRIIYSGGTFYQYGDSSWQDIAANTTINADTASFVMIIPEPATIFLILAGLALTLRRK